MMPLHLDPRTKLCLILLCVLSAMFAPNLQFQFALVALIGLLGSAAGAFVGVVTSAKLTNYRIEQLEKKVDKHNTVIERTYKLEETQAVIQEQIKVANHRIGDLEKEREE